MIREVKYKDNLIQYNLTRKRVKNINLRIKPDLTVEVSANSRVSLKYLDDFVIKKADFILRVQNEFLSQKSIEREPKMSVEELRQYVLNKSNETYEQYITIYNIDKPLIKFRKMKSRWGSCNFVKFTITLNTNLIYCDKEQIDYVIIHEFSHLIVHNHSKDFYSVVQKFFPDYKRIKKEMAGIII